MQISRTNNSYQSHRIWGNTCEWNVWFSHALILDLSVSTMSHNICFWYSFLGEVDEPVLICTVKWDTETVRLTILTRFQLVKPMSCRFLIPIKSGMSLTERACGCLCVFCHKIKIIYQASPFHDNLPLQIYWQTHTPQTQSSQRNIISLCFTSSFLYSIISETFPFILIFYYYWINPVFISHHSLFFLPPSCYSYWQYILITHVIKRHMIYDKPSYMFGVSSNFWPNFDRNGTSNLPFFLFSFKSNILRDSHESYDHFLHE